MSKFVTYDERILNRYVCDLSVGEGEPIKCIIDTGCPTTLIPLKYAKNLGKKLKRASDVIVGGKTYQANLYLLENVTFGNFKINKMLAFASNYQGAIEERILLGLNVLNNLEISFSRHKEALHFNYKPWSLVGHKDDPFVLYFNGPHPVYLSDNPQVGSARLIEEDITELLVDDEDSLTPLSVFRQLKRK